MAVVDRPVCVSADSGIYSIEGLQNQTSQSETTIMTDSPSPGTSVKVALVSDVSTFPSGATSPTVYGAGGPPGGAVGSPGQKRSVSGTGNTLKVITDRTRTDICNYVSGKHF